MDQIVIFVLGVLIGAGVVWFFVRKKLAQHSNILKNVGMSEGGLGLIEKQAQEKEENKQKISQFLEGKEKISNNDIEQLLGVSDATATRYLDELEKEGKIRQVGKTGRSVFYKKI